MKIGDMRIGYSKEEIAAAIIGGNLEEIKGLLEGFGLEKDFPVFLPRARKVASIILSYASVFAGRSQVPPEVTRLLIDNLSRNIDIFLFLDTVLYYLRIDTRDEETHPSQEIISILSDEGPSDEFGGRIAIMNENEFLALVQYIVGGKVESIRRDFSAPIVRFISTHPIMPLTLLFAYMASSLKEPDFDSDLAGSIVGQILDGIMSESDEEDDT